MRRKWITITRIFRYGLNNFSRNAWLTTAATAVMTVTLLIIMTTLIARMVFADTIAQVRQKIDVSVYLKDEVTTERRNEFIKDIKKVDIVTDVEYISKEQARATYQEQNKTDLTQLEAFGELDTNPIPATLRVKTKDPNKLEELNKVLLSDKNKQLQVSNPSNSGERKAAIENIARVSQFTEAAGLVTCIIFVVISIMIIFNTIRMAIFNRRDEIEMMKLIGADKSFIRGPFIVEACMYGVLAAAVSIIIIYSLLLTRAGELATYEIQIGQTLAFFKQWPIVVILGQLAIGVFIGVLSSYLAIRRYLKV